MTTLGIPNFSSSSNSTLSTGTTLGLPGSSVRGQGGGIASVQGVQGSIASAIPGVDTSQVQGGIASRGTAIGDTEAANLARTFQGDTADPNYIRAASTGRILANQGASNSIANLNLQQQQKNQELEMQRRSQLLQLAGLGEEVNRFRSQQQMAESQFNLTHPKVQTNLQGIFGHTGLSVGSSLAPNQVFSPEGGGGGGGGRGNTLADPDARFSNNYASYNPSGYGTGEGISPGPGPTGGIKPNQVNTFVGA